MCLAAVGFMMKLPAPFRKIDKEMHALFYGAAVLGINLFLLNKNIFIHLLISGFLFAFSYTIEHAQAYSNRFFKRRIHGNFDPEDIEANISGLLYGSIIWVIVVIVYYIFKKISNTNKS